MLPQEEDQGQERAQDLAVRQLPPLQLGTSGYEQRPIWTSKGVGRLQESVGVNTEIEWSFIFERHWRFKEVHSQQK